MTYFLFQVCFCSFGFPFLVAFSTTALLGVFALFSWLDCRSVLNGMLLSFHLILHCVTLVRFQVRRLGRSLMLRKQDPAKQLCHDPDVQAVAQQLVPLDCLQFWWKLEERSLRLHEMWLEWPNRSDGVLGNIHSVRTLHTLNDPCLFEREHM